MPTARDAITWISSPRRRKTTGQLRTTPTQQPTETGSPKPRIRSIMTPPPARPTTAYRALSVPANLSPDSSPSSLHRHRHGKPLSTHNGKGEEEDLSSVMDSGYFGIDTITSLNAHLSSSSHQSDSAPAAPAPAAPAATLTTHLERIHSLLEQMSLERQNSLSHVSRMLKKMLVVGEENVKRERRTSQALDLSPLNEYFGMINRAIERQTGVMEGWIGSGGGVGMLVEEVRGLRDVLDEGNRLAVVGRVAPVVDLGGLEGHIERVREGNEENGRLLRESHEENARLLREVLGRQSRDQDLGTKVDEVNEHLRSLREWSEYDSEHLKQLLRLQKEKQSGAATGNANVHQRMDRIDARMKDLMAGQREMVEVMRQLADSINASTKGQCEHVVVPPPRKMGRKIVGFVYDAKEK